jgi:hypothetical protein
MTWNMKKEPILLQIDNDKMILKYAYDKSFTVRLSEGCEWKDGLKTDRKEGLIWCTVGSNKSTDTEAVVYGYGTRQ